MASLTACVIAKNEERILQTSLQSISEVVDEIVLVDTGSTDKTVDIAKSFGSKIYHNPWVDDFSIMYNYCFSKATSDYCLLWDADFVLENDSISELKKLKASNFDSQDQISLKWNTQFDQVGKPTSFVYRPLIFKSNLFQWKYPTHSIPIPKSANISKLIKPEIIVNHRFDPQKRNNITKQHSNIVLKYIKKHPKDAYMNMAYIEESFAFGNYSDVVETSLPFINNLDAFPFPIQLIELVVFSYLQLGDISKAIDLVYSNSHKYLYRSRKFDILYADMLLYSDLNKSLKIFRHAANQNNYNFEQNDVYDLNRLKHLQEFATLDQKDSAHTLNKI